MRIAYPDHIRPLLLRKVAAEAGYNARHVAKVSESVKFKIRQRQCLFLGLSDGAHIDVFRRSNNPELSHEQMLQTYEISSERVESLLKKLADDMANLLGGAAPDHMPKFRTVVLLDDLSASGTRCPFRKSFTSVLPLIRRGDRPVAPTLTGEVFMKRTSSYLTREQDGTFGGKIGRFYRNVTNPRNEVSRLVDLQHTEIFVVLCLATEQAYHYLENLLKEMWEPLGTEYNVIVVHPLKDDHCLKPGGSSGFETLLNAYYDPTIEDEHTQKGGTDLKYGFAACGLPLVLSHNTPNNSLYLLWAESKKVRALFPRVSRHIGSVGIGEKYEGTA